MWRRDKGRVLSLQDHRRRDRPGQPDAILGLIKDLSLPVHLTRRNGQDHRLAVPLPDRGGRVAICPKMHILPVPRQQPLPHDAVQKAYGGAVIQEFGRLHRQKAQIDRDRMPLTGADAQPVGRKGKAFIVARRDDFVQLPAGQRNSGARQPIVDARPPACLKFKTDRIGL